MTESELALPDPRPDRDSYVLAQGFPFDPKRWKGLIGDPAYWPGELAAAPVVGRWPQVDRRTVFDIAGRADDPLGAVHLLVAVLVWGTGTKALSAVRRGRIFTENSWDTLQERLPRAVRTLDWAGAGDAYASLTWCGENRINELGPAFFTKFLYFAGWDRTDAPKPLILDRNVALALNHIHGRRWSIGPGWSTQEYQEYLAVAQEHAARLDVSQDMVERALFDLGRKLARAERHGIGAPAPRPQVQELAD